ncbi:hypothetical protein J4558_22490 [Leptolyngbya sp. 15MV]|nr:hypothetical protein J4558_22490 [Leptolyngbya sp. 15MV]
MRTPRELLTVHALSEEVLTCEGSGIGTFDVRMTSENLRRLEQTGIEHRVLIADIQAHLDQIWADDARIRRGEGAGGVDDLSWFSTYRSLAEIEARMVALATAYPNLATYSTIGSSIEGRSIRMLRITGPGPTTGRPAFFINATQHAREWVTPMSAMYIADRFLETYGTDTRVQHIVNNVDFYIVPVVNPDGYEFSRTSNANWRKNRRVNSGSSCRGVDLNRNWGFQWGFDNTGSSGNPCSDIYRGSAGFSEPELQAIRAVVDQLRTENRLKVHWDIHANAQMLLSPWGYTTSNPPDLALMNTLGLLMQQGMQTVRGLTYPYGPGSQILYLNNGNARDYSYGVHGAMSWTIELTGVGFQPPVSEILPNAREAMAALLPLAEFYIPAPACYANCDGSTGSPVLSPSDFVCFLNKYRAGDAYANCDGSTGSPALSPSVYSDE